MWFTTGKYAEWSSRPVGATDDGGLATARTFSSPSFDPVLLLQGGPFISPIHNLMGVELGATGHAASVFARLYFLTIAGGVTGRLGHYIRFGSLVHVEKFAEVANVRNG